MCYHEIASGRLAYDRDTHHLIHKLVCDSCGLEIDSVLGAEYQPSFVAYPPPKES